MPLARAALVLLLALASGDVGALTARRACRASCGAAIEACMATGGHRARCRKSVLRRCRQEGVAACERIQSVTTTTVPSFGTYTTTTLPGSAPHVTVADVRTAFEIDWYVPHPGAEYVLVGVSIDNGASYALTPNVFQLVTGGLAFAQGYIVPSSDPFPGCAAFGVTILPGGSLTCTLVFEIPEGTTSGRLALGGVYGPGYPPSPVLTDEFSIPVVPRPGATLDVVTASVATAPSYCSARPGFVDLAVGIVLASHDGATGLTLDPYQFVLESAGARYQVDGCSYQLPDMCSAAIGVPIDGSAGCSLVFEVPASVASGQVRSLNDRYPATAPFDLD